MMKIVEVLKMKRYLAIAIISSTAMAFVYVYTQVLGIIENVDLWLTIIPWYNAILFIVFTGLFGVSFAYQIYLWKQPKVCATGTKVKGIGTGGIGTMGVFLIAQCPACASLGVLFLPISVVGFFTQFSWLLNILAIGLMLFTLRYLGAFKKDEKLLINVK